MGFLNYLNWNCSIIWGPCWLMIDMMVHDWHFGNSIPRQHIPMISCSLNHKILNNMYKCLGLFHSLVPRIYCRRHFSEFVTFTPRGSILRNIWVIKINWKIFLSFLFLIKQSLSDIIQRASWCLQRD